jgi:hypothetical protein
MKKFKVQITGDRKWDDWEIIFRELSRFNPAETIIIHGDADGADSIAGMIAEEMGFEVIPMPAHWRHNCDQWVLRYGPCPPDCKEYCGVGAGPIRNRKMAKLNADLVLAFHKNIKKSKGTKDMVEVCEKKGMEVRIISE